MLQPYFSLFVAFAGGNAAEQLISSLRNPVQTRNWLKTNSVLEKISDPNP
jgi:hypothetical protein